MVVDSVARHGPPATLGARLLRCSSFGQVALPAHNAARIVLRAGGQVWRVCRPPQADAALQEGLLPPKTEALHRVLDLGCFFW